MRRLVERARAAWAAIRRPRDYDSIIKEAHAELRSVQPSTRIVPDIDDSVKESPAELYKTKSGAELRKLANYAMHGTGTEKNEMLASGLWAAGAMKGDVESAYSVAQCLLNGVGIAKEVYGGPNEDAALDVLEKIVAQVPHGWSMFSIATILTKRHAEGTTEADRVATRRALDLFRRAAELSVAPACLNVSNFYALGIGTEKDEVKSLQWLRRAARLGDPIAQVQLAHKLSKGEGLEKDDERAFKLFLKATESGRPTSLYNVGVAFLVGQGVERDDSKALEYFQRAAHLGFVPAKLNLATMYEQGRGIAQNFDEALRLLREVERDGFAEDVKDTIAYVERRKALADAGQLEGLEAALGGGFPLIDDGAAQTGGGGGGGGARGEELKSAATGTAGATPETAEAVVWETKSASSGMGPASETLEVAIHVEDPEVLRSLLEEINKRPNLRRDEIVKLIEEHSKSKGIKVKAMGVVDAASGSAATGGGKGSAER